MQTRHHQKFIAAAALATGLVLASGCTDKPGSQGWCDQMSAKSKGDWTGDETKTFAAHCVFERTTIGSEAWCDNLNETPKGEWTTQEVADYAKYCVVEQITQ